MLESFDTLLQCFFVIKLAILGLEKYHAIGDHIIKSIDNYKTKINQLIQKYNAALKANESKLKTLHNTNEKSDYVHIQNYEMKYLNLFVCGFCYIIILASVHGVFESEYFYPSYFKCSFTIHTILLIGHIVIMILVIIFETNYYYVILYCFISLIFGFIIHGLWIFFDWPVIYANPSILIFCIIAAVSFPFLINGFFILLFIKNQIAPSKKMYKKYKKALKIKRRSNEDDDKLDEITSTMEKALPEDFRICDWCGEEYVPGDKDFCESCARDETEYFRVG